MHRTGCVIREDIKTNSFHTFFFLLRRTSIQVTLAFFRKFHFWSGIFWVQIFSNVCTGNMNTKSTVLPCHNLFAYPNFEHYSFTVLAHCECDRFTTTFEFKLEYFHFIMECIGIPTNWNSSKYLLSQRIQITCIEYKTSPTGYDGKKFIIIEKFANDLLISM